MTPFAAVFLLELEQGIVVETDSPDAHCPDLHQTREAVSARLGTIQGTGWRARYTIVHAPGDVPRDFVLLELAAPEGAVRLRRELPIGASCAGVSDAIALVLDQYFRALIAPEEGEPEPAAPATDESRGRAATGGPVAPPEKPPAEPSGPSFRATLEVAAMSFTASIAAGVRLEALLSPSWHAGLEVSLPLSERVEALPGGGEARARSIELAAHLGFGPELGPLRPYAGPTLFTLFERGHTTAPLTSSAQYRLLVGAGGELGLNIRLDQHWHATGFASGGGIFAQSAAFAAGGEEVLDGIGWVGKAGLGLAYAF